MELKNENNPAQWALDLLEPTPVDQSNHIAKYYLVPLMSFVGVQAVRYWNHMNERPKNANKPHMVVVGAGLGLVGYLLQKTSDIYVARRYAVMRHYITLHPDRFPPPENRKYGDLFKPWAPIR